MDLSALNGTNGFQISGEAGNDRSGYYVAGPGDVNGDGFGAVLIWAPGADTNCYGAGTCSVVFELASGFLANLDLSGLNGTNGFEISGEATLDYSGTSVCAAGDVNGDG